MITLGPNSLSFLYTAAKPSQSIIDAARAHHPDLGSIWRMSMSDFLFLAAGVGGLAALALYARALSRL
ncbi:hypothetical protein [Sinorhizobium prairiense]|uniref:hypothetical protein n=1 Tax=unclassified Sinorhizobium TaxID=2613772 RepID=UPI0023D86882|nr:MULTISPECIES: hypothetical protein [unclassified Sinorhizobium]WEJ11807.1 hypothetical protein N0Q90_22080 [Sinorhizobium sp. M103]WEJ17671.1 hypothetical protein N0Q91_20955 [Sinorhizobium sp. K101]WEJ40378.1 hypothetical protein N0R80_30940 [Sinorhizobium sp. C101]